MYENRHVTTLSNLFFSQFSCAEEDQIKNLFNCEWAAKELKLADTTVEDDEQSGVSYDPPYCYYENGKLLFNSDGTNKGPCNKFDQCLCRGSTTSTTSTTTTTTTTNVGQVDLFSYGKCSDTAQLKSLHKCALAAAKLANTNLAKYKALKDKSGEVLVPQL